MTTKKEAALDAVGRILKAAKGADCIVTICPMCQMNLDSYQSKASKIAGEDLTVSILYLPQFIGLALGLSEEELKLKSNFVFTRPLQKKLQQGRVFLNDVSHPGRARPKLKSLLLPRRSRRTRSDFFVIFVVRKGLK